MPQFIRTRSGNCTGNLSRGSLLAQFVDKWFVQRMVGVELRSETHATHCRAVRRASKRIGVELMAQFRRTHTGKCREAFGMARTRRALASALPSGQFTNKLRVEQTTAQSMPARSSNPRLVPGVDAGIGQYGQRPI